MFSALGSIFSIKPRQAEQTDTRQALQRHDPDYEQNRKKKESSPDQDLNDDGASVSVEALRIFLENFVRNGAEDEKNHAAPAEEDTFPEPQDYKIQQNMDLQEADRNETKPGQAAMVASVYESTAQTKDNTTLFETTDQAQGPALDLQAADIRTIHILIEDLKTLAQENIEYLHIERAETFLDSLVNAVHKAKTHIAAPKNA